MQELITFGQKYKKIQISIECCSDCYLHPSQNHVQLNFISKINEIQQQLARTFPHSPIVIKKNDNNDLKPRLNAFEVKYKRLLIFSKIQNRKFPKSHDIATLIMCLCCRKSQQILTIKNNLRSLYNNRDLFSYLRQKCKNIRLPYKFVAAQIEKIIKIGIKIEKIKQKTENLAQNVQNSQQVPKRNLFSSRFKYNSQRHMQKSNPKLSIVPKKQSIMQQQCIGLLKYSRKISRITSIQNKQANRNSHLRVSQITKQQIVQKYSYLTKQMDTKFNLQTCSQFLNTNNKVQQQFQLLELSREEGELGINDTQWTQQKLAQRRIQQGLNFKIIETHKQNKTDKKYSSQYKKFAELLEKQLRQDQIKERQKNGKNLQNLDEKYVKNSDQDSVSQQNNKSRYHISMNQLQNNVDLLVIETNKQIKQSVDEELKNSMVFIMENSIIANQQLVPLNIQTQIKKYYEEGYVHSKINGLIQNNQQKQLYIDSHYLQKNQELSRILININKQFPQIFREVLQNNNIQSIKLQNKLCQYKIVLFNSILGLFIRYNVRIQLSFQYLGNIPQWALIICQVIQPFLQQSSDIISQLLKLITGAPIVKIPANDLRKFKKIILQSNFQYNQDDKGRIICTGGAEQEKIQFCQILQFKKQKDILKSLINYRQLTQNQEQQPIFTKIYEQFAITYQLIMLWMYHSRYYHNQKRIKFQTDQREYNRNLINPTCKIIFSIPESSKIFLEFTQHQKIEKPNHILISKIIQKQGDITLQPVGQLHKKGNFFFQLCLQPTNYFVQISRCFDNEQVNSIHFYSSSPVEIKKCSVDYEEISGFQSYL